MQKNHVIHTKYGCIYIVKLCECLSADECLECLCYVLFLLQLLSVVLQAAHASARRPVDDLLSLDLVLSALVRYTRIMSRTHGHNVGSH